MTKITHNLKGMRFGRLVVQFFIPNNGGRWSCLCDCGSVAEIRSQNLRIGKTKSCGCYKHEIMAAGMNVKHGMYGTRTFKTWDSMIQRCTLKTDPNYHRYGARGVMVCDSWKSFEGFYADMGKRPDGMTLDRKENNGNYEPSNCRWATPMQQANNRSNNRLIRYRWKEITVRELANETGVDYMMLRSRVLANGWDVERAVCTPNLRNWLERRK